MVKNSMRQALGASLSAEKDAFASRLARAEAQFPSEPSSLGGIGEGSAQVEVAPAPKVIREAFTIPEAEHGQIEAIRAQMLAGAVAVSKSEVLRAGLLLLAEASEEQKRAVFERLERVKTGRPKSS